MEKNPSRLKERYGVDEEEYPMDKFLQDLLRELELIGFSKEFVAMGCYATDPETNRKTVFLCPERKKVRI